MKILVIGCGKVGGMLVERLTAEGHDVVVVENNPAVIEEITNMHDVMCACGNSTDCDTLSEAGAETADLAVAVTGSDELNMLSCFLARRMGTKHTIARIRNTEYSEKNINFMKQQLDLSVVINPERLAAREMYNILKFPSAVKVETFSARTFEMVEIHVPADGKMVGMTLSELKHHHPGNYLIAAVERENQVFIPDGSFRILGDDHIGITAAPNEVQKLLKSTGMLQKKARNILILGGSRIAVYLAKFLIAGGHRVKIIERDEKRCAEISATLPEATVIHGDGASQELLMEESLPSMDAFVALTGMDEQNLLVSLFASAQNVPKIIAKVNRRGIVSVADRLDLDCIITPKLLVADVVSRYARAVHNTVGSKVETLYHLMNDKAEALEFKVQEEFSHLGIPLKDLTLKPNILIAGIIRNRKPIIPNGSDAILSGDRVVVLAAGQHLDDLEDILK